MSHVTGTTSVMVLGFCQKSDRNQRLFLFISFETKFHVNFKLLMNSGKAVKIKSVGFRFNKICITYNAFAI